MSSVHHALSSLQEISGATNGAGSGLGQELITHRIPEPTTRQPNRACQSRPDVTWFRFWPEALIQIRGRQGRCPLAGSALRVLPRRCEVASKANAPQWRTMRTHCPHTSTERRFHNRTYSASTTFATVASQHGLV